MLERRVDRGLPLTLILVLSLLSATSPLATDVYLASFPEIARGLHTDGHHVQLTLTAFMLGLGVGQVLWGPLSDRVGRLRPLIVGTAVATIASAVTVMAPNVEVLIGARFIQAVAAAAGLVISRAIIADLTRGFAAAQAISLMMTINAVAPVAGPVVGGLLVGHVPWRGVLAVILAIMLLQAVGAVTVVRETLPPDRRKPRLSYRALITVARRPPFIAYAGTLAFAFGAIMTYVSSASFVYQSVLGFPGWGFGLCFAVNALGIVGGGRLTSVLAHRRVHPARTLRWAIPLLAGGSIVTLAAASSPWPLLILLPLFSITTAFGLIAGNASAFALEQARDHAGAASAVMGGLQFLVGGTLSAFSGIADEDTAVPMGAIMLGSALVSAACFLTARRVVSHGSEAAFH